MKFNDWLNERRTQGPIDTDGAYSYQCMDLYNDYCHKVLELIGTGAACAKSILTSDSVILANTERIDNYPDFVPQKGDIAIWTGNENGHVAICLGEGNKNWFKTIEQNWKKLQLSEETHDYLYLGPIVYLRPKNQSNIVEEQKQEETVVTPTHSVGEKVRVSSYYASSTSPVSEAVLRTAVGTITKVLTNGCHNPYLLNNGDIGWCNDGDIREVVIENKKSDEEIAREIIKKQGGWGDYPERKQRLEAAGYNYDTIQAIVNKLMGY